MNSKKSAYILVLLMERLMDFVVFVRIKKIPFRSKDTYAGGTFLIVC